MQAYEDTHLPVYEMPSPQEVVDFMLEQKRLSRRRSGKVAGWWKPDGGIFQRDSAADYPADRRFESTFGCSGGFAIGLYPIKQVHSAERMWRRDEPPPEISGAVGPVLRQTGFDRREWDGRLRLCR